MGALICVNYHFKSLSIGGWFLDAAFRWKSWVICNKISLFDLSWGIFSILFLCFLLFLNLNFLSRWSMRQMLTNNTEKFKVFKYVSLFERFSIEWALLHFQDASFAKGMATPSQDSRYVSFFWLIQIVRQLANGAGQVLTLNTCTFFLIFLHKPTKLVQNNKRFIVYYQICSKLIWIMTTIYPYLVYLVYSIRDNIN